MTFFNDPRALFCAAHLQKSWNLTEVDPNPSKTCTRVLLCAYTYTQSYQGKRFLITPKALGNSYLFSCCQSVNIVFLAVSDLELISLLVQAACFSVDES